MKQQIEFLRQEQQRLWLESTYSGSIFSYSPTQVREMNKAREAYEEVSKQLKQLLGERNG